MNFIQFSRLSTGLNSTLLMLGLECLPTIAPASGREAGLAHFDQHKTWKQYGGGADQSKYMDLKQITKANGKQVEVVWNYADTFPGGNFFHTIVVDGVMYVVAKRGCIVA